MEILNMEEESVHAKSVVYTWTKSKRIKKKKLVVENLRELGKKMSGRKNKFSQK
jgi:hypothetical protein